MAAFMVGSAIYRQVAFGSNHPLAIPRLETVYDLCRILGWLDDSNFVESPIASVAKLATFHDPKYIEALFRSDREGRVTVKDRATYAIGTMQNPLFTGVFERAATSVGGSIRAAELALEGHIAYHPSGGTHHGRPDRASGFCYFNDPVFAILTLLDHGRRRVLYVDLDAHHGDGVQDAFALDDRVWTMSIHEGGRWPHTGASHDRGGGQSCNLPVPPNCNDSEFRYLLDRDILPLARWIAPDALVITCGADPLRGDPLSKMALSNVALWDAVMDLVVLTRSCVVLGGGGYNPWTLARFWTGLWGRLAGYDLPSGFPHAAREILANLECDLVDEEDIELQWFTGLQDAPNDGQVRDSVRQLGDSGGAGVYVQQ